MLFQMHGRTNYPGAWLGRGDHSVFAIATGLRFCSTMPKAREPTLNQRETFWCLVMALPVLSRREDWGIPCAASIQVVGKSLFEAFLVARRVFARGSSFSISP